MKKEPDYRSTSQKRAVFPWRWEGKKCKMVRMLPQIEVEFYDGNRAVVNRAEFHRQNEKWQADYTE